MTKEWAWRVWLPVVSFANLIGGLAVTEAMVNAAGGISKFLNPIGLLFWLWALSPHVFLQVVAILAFRRRARFRWPLAASLAVLVASFFAWEEYRAMQPIPGVHMSSTSALAFLFGPLWANAGSLALLGVTQLSSLRRKATATT